jgi:hypothetical protein
MTYKVHGDKYEKCTVFFKRTAIIHLLFLLCLFLNNLSLLNIGYLIIYLAINFFIDIKEYKIIRFEISQNKLIIFFSNILVRLLLITGVSFLLVNNSKKLNIEIFNNFFHSFLSGFTGQLTYENKLLIGIILIVIGLWGVGIFIGLFIDSIIKKNSEMLKKENSKQENSKQEPDSKEDLNKNSSTIKAGFIIGIMERFFIICAVILGMSQVVGFVLATKSVARLSKFNNDNFVEIFIIGNFISFTSAIIIGVILKNLDILPHLIKTIE